MKKFFLFLSLSLFVQLPLPAAFGTQYDAQKVKEQQKKHVDLMKDYHTIKEPIDFPDLPAYSGHSKFVIGNYSPDQNGVTNCHMQFTSEEEPQTIINFYKNALPANNWKIQYASIHGICARHGKGHMCNINVNESKIPKIKSTFEIDYRQIEQQH